MKRIETLSILTSLLIISSIIDYLNSNFDIIFWTKSFLICFFIGNVVYNNIFKE